MKSQVFELSKQGHNLLKSRRFSEAFALFEQALELDEENPYILTGMGDALRLQKNFTGAEQYYRQVLDNDPNNLFSLRGLGDVLRGQHRFAEAIEQWSTYLRLRNNSDVFVITRIADGYKTLEEYDKAHSFYQQALSLNPSDNFALGGMADLCNRRGLIPQSIGLYEKLLAAGGATAGVLTVVGNLHWKQNDYEQAMTYYERALQLEPGNVHALYGAGNYHRIVCDYHRAAELWEKILASSPGTINLLARLGDVYRNIGRLNDAERIYSKGLERGYDKFTLVGMMKLKCQTGNLQAACDCYEVLFRTEGEDSRFFAEAGKILVENGYRDRALQFYRFVQQIHANASAPDQSVGSYIAELE